MHSAVRCLRLGLLVDLRGVACGMSATMSLSLLTREFLS